MATSKKSEVVLVTGDRNWRALDVIVHVLEKHPTGTILVQGGARGADTMAKLVGEDLGFEVREYPYIAELGRAGGPARNVQMLKENPDIVYAFHDDIAGSKGTKHMLSECHKRGIPYELYDSSGARVEVDPAIFKKSKKK